MKRYSGVAAALAAITTHAAGAAGAAVHQSNACCNALSKHPSLAGKVAYPDTALYSTRLDSYWSSSAALAPWCMVLPTATDEVSAVASVLSTNQCPFGIRSGGHSQWAGASSVQDGVTIDLGFFNSTTFDADRQVASIRPGSRWQGAYDTLEPFGVSVPGGRAGIVGVAGFTLGGGYSYYFNSLGFAADNVVNYEAVLADGQVVNASADENADLWHALKGSSGNLGLVTRFDIRTIPSIAIWGGLTTYELGSIDAVWQAFANFADNVDADPASQSIVYTIFVGGQFIVQSLLTNHDALDTAAAFAEFRTVPATGTTATVRTIADLANELSGGQPIGIHADWFVTQFKTDVRIMKFVAEQHTAMIETLQTLISPDAQLQTLCQFQPVSPSAVAKGKESGGNVMGLDAVVPDGKATTMFLFTAQVVTPEDEPTIIAHALDFIDKIDEFSKSLGQFIDWKFLNYAYKTQNPIASYGAQDVGLIKAAAAKYDPKGVFQKLRHSGFKIPA
ncbi:FAD binding domain-containing protein [Microdochium trichocladiopsis]|uniref:FAD binding domain-containing protein n=1 Tax=Microdochium trichocladiopsis TaxID=1682393 RepID=A0A9P8YDU1_9PEZI|nr:FAD binding domain-containing protein [Microdochium trichocladiopsis]KAH7037037.1 FAD binding domain-containing protein [Microdochium trichocladiopsis]